MDHVCQSCLMGLELDDAESDSDTFLPFRPVGPVFHYTDAQGVSGIVSNGIVRASQASMMNDPDEGSFGWDLIRRRVTDLVWAGELENADFAEVLFGTEWTTVALDYFVASGTAGGDDLAQYRLYGMYQVQLVDSAGWTLQFHDETPELAVTPFAWRSVVYGEKRSVEYIDALVGWALTLDLQDPDSQDRILRAAARLAMHIKTDSYEHEREARMLVYVPYRAWGDYVLVRVRGDLLVPYLETRPKDYGPAAAAVCVGPAGHSVAAARAVQQLQAVTFTGADRPRIPVTLSSHKYRG